MLIIRPTHCMRVGDDDVLCDRFGPLISVSRYSGSVASQNTVTCDPSRSHHKSDDELPNGSSAVIFGNVNVASAGPYGSVNVRLEIWVGAPRNMVTSVTRPVWLTCTDQYPVMPVATAAVETGFMTPHRT